MAGDDLCKIPVAKRPPITWARFFKGLLFVVLFDFGCFMVHGTQLVFLFTLRWLPFQWSRRLYNEGIRYTKGAFGCLLILMCEWFAPTKLSITFETEGKGKLSPDEIENIVTRNSAGEVERLNLPTKIVLISNHQVYADWWYAWCLLYFIGPKGVHRYIYITLKKSLKWLPVVGWGMQLYNFIFLARSWASDRVQLASHLSSLGREAEEEDNPFCFLLYPEGTLVSPNTRPISKKFAEKTGVSDMTNILLPRSTGLHYSLRSLSPRVPDLRLLDLTVVYPGIPPLGYGQDYYTLRSVFVAGVPPPVVHIHIRVFDVAKEVPIGDLTKKPTLSSGKLPDARIAEVDIPEQEKEVFDHWLRERWEEKDAEITNFLDNATFKNNDKPVEIPVRLRKKLEVLDAFCFFIPASVGYLWRKVRQ